MKLSFVSIQSSLSEWSKILDTLPERTIFQTAEWLSFVAKTQGGKVVLASLQGEKGLQGYFAGIINTKMGIRILGSPLPGWATSYMGINLLGNVPRGAAVKALIRFAFDELHCMHVEMMDRKLVEEEARTLGLPYQLFCGFEIDLSQTEDRLLANMSSACRRCVRMAKTNGVTIEEAKDAQFADDYYKQLREVFKRQHLVPTYDVERVRELIACVHGSGHLLLLRARDPQGRCIATGIYPAMNGTMYFWGGASWKASQGYRPNEALHWYAMRYWKSRGMKTYDMGGGGEYKRKYGGYEVSVPWIRASRYRGIGVVRHFAKRLFYWRQSALGIFAR
jgi:hypothetical protein